MNVNRCLNCMELFEEGKICPRCGFDNGSQAIPYSLRPNTILHGKYLIGRMLGQGGFGITYMGFDLSLEVKVAVKEYFPMNQSFRDNTVSNEVRVTTALSAENQWQEGCESFLREARKMAKIREVPELVGVRETFKENNTSYIIMDYVEGITLKDWLGKNGTIDFGDCVKLFLPLMEGLDRVHCQGLIHRDISPDNIMIQPDGKPKLLDLGAAKDLYAGNNGASQLVARNGFSPPEQYREQGEIGPWTDVYAFCATLYYCITGRLVPNALDRVDSDRLELPGTLTRQQADVLKAGMALERKKRIQSVSVLTKQLQAAVQNTKQRRKIPGIAAILTGGVAAVALAIGIYSGTGRGDGEKPVPDVTEIPAGTAVPAGADGALRVEALGCTNANLFQGANFAMIPGQYFYYADRDWNLYVLPYDQEESMFWVETEGILVADDEVGYINIGSDKVYFIHDEPEESGNPDRLMQMDFDGGNIVTLLSDGGYFGLQYARLTDGKEYLYYLKEDDDPEDFGRTLCRFDLETGMWESVLPESIWSFSLYERHIYYTVISGENVTESVWKCAELDGQNEKVLNDSDNLVYGYVEDGAAYMYSLKEEVLYQYGLDGQKTGNSLVMHQGGYCCVYGDGWIYYSDENGNEVHRIRPDGKNDEVIFQGGNITRMCYVNSILWMLQAKEVDGEPVTLQTYLVSKDGSNTVVIEEEYTDTMPAGLEYRIEDGVLVLVDYKGKDSRIVVPWIVDREPVTNIHRSGSFPEDVDIYCYPQDNELTCELTEDGTGVVLTGCGGGLTEGYPFLALPDRIDGVPLVKLADCLFAENTSIQGIILPEGLEEIGEAAFDGASQLSYVRLPHSLKSIGDWAFGRTGSLTEVTLPEGLENLGYYAFANGVLREAELPSTLLHMGGNPFANGTMESVTLAEGLKGYYLENGAVYLNGAESEILIVPAMTMGAFHVMDGTTAVGNFAFFQTNITEVFLPASITVIQMGAFEGANKLRAVHLEESLVNIESEAFDGCSSLREIVIPQSVKEIGINAFRGCESLEAVTVSRDCIIAENAFENGVEISFY